MVFLKRFLPWALVFLIIIATPFAYFITTAKSTFPISTPKVKLVLTLWQVDTFEGGIGSRTDFLNEASVDFSDGSTLILVKSHTVESVKNALQKGEIPDMISYGVGVDSVVPLLKSLPKIDFLGGENGGKIYAYPWCVGGYYLITKTENNQLIDRLFVSQGAFNLVYGAILESDVEAKEMICAKPLNAYTSFLSGKKEDALVGTQRDIWRLDRRGAEYFAKPIHGFSDIVQYASVLTGDRVRYDESVRFLKYLTSQKIQQKLEKIGMHSPYFKMQYGGALGEFDFSKIKTTVSPFTSAEAVTSLIGELKRQSITNSSLLTLKNMQKHL